MKEFIKDILVQMHIETTTDKYGQVGRSNFTPSLFGDRKDEVEQYCSVNKGILQYSTYRAFTIEDEEIRKACSEVLHKNENYIRNVSSY